MYINDNNNCITLNNLLPEICIQESNKTDFFDILVDEELLKGKIIFPSNVESTDKIPLIVVTYGGPGIQIVNNKYNTGYSLISNIFCEFGFAVASIDNRGTANRGTRFESVLKNGFGEFESFDNISMINFLIEKYKLSNNQLIGHKRDKLLKDKNQRLDFIQIINIFKYSKFCQLFVYE